MRIVPLVAICLAALLQSAAAQADSAPASGLLGRWALDIAKLPRPLGATPPKSVTLTFIDQGASHWKTTIDTVNADGSAIHAESTYGLDGTVAPVTGSFDVDMVSVVRPEANVLVMGTSLKGRPGNTRLFTVSPDGKSQTETIVSHGPDGLPATRANHWSRVD